MRWIETVLDVPLFQTFLYEEPDSDEKSFEIEIGKRVEVNFGQGTSKKIGYIIDILEKLPETLPFSKEKIKKAIRVLDREIIFTKEQIDMARWISSYYICSLGEALAVMVPSGKREKSAVQSSFADEDVIFSKCELSDEQEIAVNGILKEAESGVSSVQYLYGATGSGKTEVFLRLTEYMLKKGKGIIYLVPEIGLTKQVIDAVIQRFGNTVAVIHSNLTQSQKLSEWKKILSKNARIVIGARSAVFAPVPDLGLIIIDEEHDSSYKSNSTPRYHARQVAFYRSQMLKIPLVMGSATPSAETWNLMKERKISRYVLSKRLSGGKMPSVEIVNLSENTQAGSCISKTLEDEIRKTKQEGKQTILFLNRRGFTHFFSCRTCGFNLTCRNCSTTMIYHKNKNILKCHYCGYQITPPECCPECGSVDLSYSGFGTEYVENQIKEKFPNYRIERIDTDSVSKNDDLQEKLKEFRNGKIDILLGTQMIAKGLNFPKVKLVGVILADTGLNMPDFRASERTFSLLLQVAGRAGRYIEDGKVIIQSFCPERDAIQFACRNDSESFYEKELEMRKILEFPPFSRLIRLVFRSKKQLLAEKSCFDAALIFKSMIVKKSDGMQNVEILGPSECPLSLLSSNYRYQIILRCEKMKPIQELCTQFIYKFVPKNGVYIEVDVDPVTLL